MASGRLASRLELIKIAHWSSQRLWAVALRWRQTVTFIKGSAVFNCCFIFFLLRKMWKKLRSLHSVLLYFSSTASLSITKEVRSLFPSTFKKKKILGGFISCLSNGHYLFGTVNYYHCTRNICSVCISSPLCMLYPGHDPSLSTLPPRWYVVWANSDVTSEVTSGWG